MIRDSSTSAGFTTLSEGTLAWRHASGPTARKTAIPRSLLVRRRLGFRCLGRMSQTEVQITRQKTQFPDPPEVAHRMTNIRGGSDLLGPLACLAAQLEPTGGWGPRRWRHLPLNKLACRAASAFRERIPQGRDAAPATCRWERVRALWFQA